MKPSFQQRFGISPKAPIDADFPPSTRSALMFILQRFAENSAIRTDISSNRWKVIFVELLRTAKRNFEEVGRGIGAAHCHELLAKLEWYQVYTFCERIYDSLISETSYYDQERDERIIQISLEENRNRFESELNTLLSEENIGYVFEQGEFRRPGRPQTQKNVSRVNAVLSDPALHTVKTHYIKAYNFFSNKNPDYENAVKEALCALEAAIEIKSGQKVSKDFARQVMTLSGIEPNQIPTPIVQAMVKLHAYRGAGTGVAHGSTEGLKVTGTEAELILSLAAAFITYTVEFYDYLEPEIPF